MNAERVKTSLKQVGKVYKEILDNTTTQNVLSNAIASVGVTKERYDYAVRNQTRGFTPEPWGYTINHDDPLRFKSTQIPNGVKLQVDIYCDIRWTDDDDKPVKQDIKVRIWSQHDETIFNPNRDSEEVFAQLSNPDRLYPGRVVSRFHFDKANPNQVGPEYHLQFGGIPEDYELCWHPKKVNVPRLIYQPMELFLTCQMIAANFFWDEYLEIREKPEWKSELVLYQNTLLYDYYQRCLDSITRKDSLVDTLWMC